MKIYCVSQIILINFQLNNCKKITCLLSFQKFILAKVSIGTFTGKSDIYYVFFFFEKKIKLGVREI